MARDYTLFDDFELQGYWWLPEREDRKVPGPSPAPADVAPDAAGRVRVDLRLGVEIGDAVGQWWIHGRSSAGELIN